MSDDPFERTSGANKAILRHPVAAVVILALTNFLIVDGVVGLEESEPSSGWWTVAVVVVMVLGAIETLLVPRILRQRPDDVIALSWVFASAIALVVVSARIRGVVDDWAPYVGAGVTACLLILTTRTALRTQRESS